MMPPHSAASAAMLAKVGCTVEQTKLTPASNWTPVNGPSRLDHVEVFAQVPSFVAVFATAQMQKEPPRIPANPIILPRSG